MSIIPYNQESISPQKNTITDNIVNHINRNRGKYAAASGVGATLGTINAAGNGYFGVRAQDAVHDIAYPASQQLFINAVKNGTTAKIDPYLDVYKKKDNILSNDNNDQLLVAEKILQKENIPAAGSYIGSKLISNLSGLTPNEKLNYMVRNPSEGIGLKIDELKAPIKGAIDSISNI